MHFATKTNPSKKEFINPEELLKEVGLQQGAVVADFGCGNGHYVVAAARLTGNRGLVYGFDILEEALSQTATLAKLRGVRNVTTKQCDLERFQSTGLADFTCDLVILSSVLHQATKRQEVVREAYRVLKSGGKVLVVDWDRDTLLGPLTSERIKKEDVRALLEQFGFRPLKDMKAGSFHFAILYGKS